MNRLLRCAAFHDLSSFGRSSLTIVIPALSAMHIQVCPVPTAVLSTHSGDFSDYSFVDLTDSMKETIAHWEKLQLTFECFYPGFLGSPRQAGLVEQAIETFSGKDSLIVVDPVLGDEGSFYTSVSPEMADAMRHLVKKAHLITPNLTEVALLLGATVEDCQNEGNVREMVRELASWGPQKVVVTSVSAEEDSRIKNIVYDQGEFVVYCNKKVPQNFPGTGDLFTSVLIGKILQGHSLQKAVTFSMAFIEKALRYADTLKEPPREGIPFEAFLEELAPERI